MTTKRKCEGSGLAAVKNPDPWKWPYPTCPVCLRDFTVSGKNGHLNAWQSVPRHFVEAA